MIEGAKRGRSEAADRSEVFRGPAHGFARAVQRPLAEPGFAVRIGWPARRLAAERYGWSEAVGAPEIFYYNVMDSFS
jgi:hypothetical protein